MAEITERDFVRKIDETHGVVFYQIDLPDGRFLQVMREGAEKFSVSRGGHLSVRVVMQWSWVVADPKTKQIMECKPVHPTRKAAFAQAMAWAEANEAGIVRPVTA